MWNKKYCTAVQFTIIKENYLFFKKTRFFMCIQFLRNLLSIEFLCIYQNIRLFLISGLRPDIRQAISGILPFKISGRIPDTKKAGFSDRISDQPHFRFPVHSYSLIWGGKKSALTGRLAGGCLSSASRIDPTPCWDSRSESLKKRQRDKIYQKYMRTTSRVILA